MYYLLISVCLLLSFPNQIDTQPLEMAAQEEKILLKAAMPHIENDDV